MTDGALLTGPVQYELGNGTTAILLGTGTRFQVEKVTGLFDLPDSNDLDSDKLNDDGGFAASTFMKKRILTFDVNVLPDDTQATRVGVQATMASDINLLRRWLQLTSTDLHLCLRPFGGAPDKIIFCRPHRRSLPSDGDLATGLGKAVFELHANDPRIYSLAQTTQSGSIAASATQTTLAVTPGGEFPTKPVITISGPATNPALSNNIDGAGPFQITYNLLVTDTIVIDFLNKTMTLNGVPNYGLAPATSRWWRLLQNQTNTITFSRTNNPATAAPISIVYRNAWA